MSKKKTFIVTTSFIVSVVFVSLVLSYYQNYRTFTNLGDILAYAAGTFLGLSDAPSSYTGKAGNVVKVKLDESGLEFGTPHKAIINGGSNMEIRPDYGVRYLSAVGTGPAGEESTTEFVMPFSGVARNLYILATSNTMNGNAVFTVRKNGADTTLSVAIAPGATSGSNIVNSFSFSAGDRITVKADPLGTSGQLNKPKFGIEIDFY